MTENNHGHGHDRVHNQVQMQHHHNHSSNHFSNCEINQFSHTETNSSNYLANLVHTTGLFPLNSTSFASNFDAQAFLKNGLMQNGEYTGLSNALSHSRGDSSV